MRLALRLIFTVLVLSFLVFLSTTPMAALRSLPVRITPTGYEVHFLSACLVAVLTWTWLRGRLQHWALLWSVVVSLLAAVAVEVVQSLLPHRGASLSDLEPAVAGSVLAVLVLFVLSEVMRVRRMR